MLTILTGVMEKTSPLPLHDFSSLFVRAGAYYDEHGHEYLTWGWWEDENPSNQGQIGQNGTDDFYTADAKIWYIEGYRTHADYIEYLKNQNFQATYIGEAKGVYANSSSPEVTALTGTCQFDINFGTGAASNAEIAVGDGGGGHIVHIWNGSGTLSSDGTFSVEFSNGTINESPIAPSPDTGPMVPALAPRQRVWVVYGTPMMGVASGPQVNSMPRDNL